jgi:hypothetical protein
MAAGPMTGGRRGLCNPAIAAGARAYTGPYAYGGGPGLRRRFGGGFGRGESIGRGYGRGYGWYPPAMVPASATAAEEMEILKAEADYLKNSLEAINKRIEDLEKKPAEEP